MQSPLGEYEFEAACVDPTEVRITVTDQDGVIYEGRLDDAPPWIRAAAERFGWKYPCEAQQ